MVDRCFFNQQSLGPIMGEPIEEMLGDYADVTAKNFAHQKNGIDKDEDGRPLWKDKLLEVWARDTLGLSQADYCASWYPF